MLALCLFVCATTPSMQLAPSIHGAPPSTRVLRLPPGSSYAQARALAARSPQGVAQQSTSPSPATLLATSTLFRLAEGSEADGPIAVQVTPDGKTAVVACRDSDSLEIVDLGSGRRLGRVLVADEPLDVALTRDGRKALVPCAGANTLCIVDVASRRLVKRVQGVGVEPYRVLLSADGTRAVVGAVTSDVDPTRGQLTRVDVGTGRVLDTLLTVRQTPVLSEFTTETFEVITPSFDMTPDARRVVFADSANFHIRVFDLDQGLQVLDVTTAFGETPTSVDVSDDGTRAVVTRSKNNPFNPGGSLEWIDVAAATAVEIPLTSWIYESDVKLSADGSRALVGTIDGLKLVDLPSGTEHLVSTDAETTTRIELFPGAQHALVSSYDTKLVDMSSGSIVSTSGVAKLRHVDVAANGTRVVGLATLSGESLTSIRLAGTTLGPPTSIGLGESREVDGPVEVAISADGLRAAVRCAVSNNFALVDLEHRSLSSVIDLRRGPVYQSAMNVDAKVALAIFNFPSELEVVDLEHGVVAASLSLSRSPLEIALAPDGRSAYLLTMETSGNAWLEFVDVDGPLSRITASLPLGILPTELFLSPAGDALAVGALNPGRLLWIDLASRTIARTVSTDLGHTAGAYTPDGRRLVVVSGSLQQAHVVDVHGTSGASQLIPGTVGTRAVQFDSSGAFAYLIGTSQGAVTLLVADVQTRQIVRTIALPGSPIGVPLIAHASILAERVGDQLFVGESEYYQRVWRLRMAGAATTFEEDVPGAFLSASGAVSWSLGTVVQTMPMFDDALLLSRFGGSASTYCDPATPNSTGQPSMLAAYGTFFAGDQRVRMVCRQLPPNRLAYLLVGDGSATSPSPFGMGTLCVSGNVARFDANPVISSAAGVAQFEVDVQSLPFAPALPVLAGQTWNFQVWHRDSVGGPTSNLSSAVAVTFD